MTGIAQTCSECGLQIESKKTIPLCRKCWRKEMEEKIFNQILESWSEGIPPNQPKIKRELARMSDKKLKENYEFFFED